MVGYHELWLRRLAQPDSWVASGVGTGKGATSRWDGRRGGRHSAGAPGGAGNLRGAMTAMARFKWLQRAASLRRLAISIRTKVT